MKSTNVTGEVPADIAPERIRHLIRGRIVGRELAVLPEAGSTNDLVMAAGREGAAEGTCVLADRQTDGRGRAGRHWSSPGGAGLYTSVLLRPPTLPAQALCLTLTAGLAVLDAIRSLVPLRPGLKWPNDVLLGTRKVAGILTEMATEGLRISQVVVGIGLNVNQAEEDFAPEIRPLATSLRLAGGASVARAAAAAALYDALDRWYDAFLTRGAEAIVAAARSETVTLGKRVRVLDAEQGWGGRALDLDASGALLVEDEAGRVRRVLADDVSIRDAE